MKPVSMETSDLLDSDKLPRIEAKVAFISMAASALGMLPEGDLDGLPPFDSKAWEGLAWITEEIANDLRKWSRQAK